MQLVNADESAVPDRGQNTQVVSTELHFLDDRPLLVICFAIVFYPIISSDSNSTGDSSTRGLLIY